MDTITIPAMFDAHVHFRETEEELAEYVPETSRCCDRALVMPNLSQPIVTGVQADRYRDAIRRHADCKDFDPLMTLYATESLAGSAVDDAFRWNPHLKGVKVYSRGATTRSAHGIRVEWLKNPNTMPEPLRNMLRAVAANDGVLNLHLEDTDAYCLEREHEMGTGFIEFYYELVGNPRARVVFEHVSDARTLHALQRLVTQGLNVACTITLHHMHMTTDHVLGRNDNLCAPVAKRPDDRQALLLYALQAPPWVMMGSDSAPHRPDKKYCEHAACGCYTAPLLVELLAETFHDTQVFHFPDPVVTRLTRFTSGNASAYYRRQGSGRTHRLNKQMTEVVVKPGKAVPWRTRAGWRLENPFTG
jgi:dihydroorotase